MIHAKCFTEYTPDEPRFGMGILYLRDDVGSDWYELQTKFSDATIKVAYSTNGVICALSSDVTTICPNNLSVVEMASNQVPSECVADGFWLYIDGDIIHNDELQNSVLKHQLMQKANVIIQPLQDAVDLGIATDEEKALLSAWKNYRVLLNRVDTNSENIEWPVDPEV